MNPAVSFAIVAALEILLFTAQAARVHLPDGSGSSKAVVAYQKRDRRYGGIKPSPVALGAK